MRGNVSFHAILILKSCELPPRLPNPSKARHLADHGRAQLGFAQEASSEHHDGICRILDRLHACGVSHTECDGTVSQESVLQRVSCTMADEQGQTNNKDTHIKNKNKKN